MKNVKKYKLGSTIWYETFNDVYKSNEVASSMYDNELLRMGAIPVEEEKKLLELEELDVSHELLAIEVTRHDTVYNRDCIILLQETVNKLIKKVKELEDK